MNALFQFLNTMTCGENIQENPHSVSVTLMQCKKCVLYCEIWASDLDNQTGLNRL